MDPDSRHIETATVAVLPDVTRNGLSKRALWIVQKKGARSFSGKSVRRRDRSSKREKCGFLTGNILGWSGALNGRVVTYWTA